MPIGSALYVRWVQGVPLAGASMPLRMPQLTARQAALEEELD